MAETILQHWLFTRFAFPFLLVFFILFAVLEKTNLFGKDKKQLNALVSFVIGLIFVTFAHPVDVVSNLVLFLTVALVIVFITLLIWGFLLGEVKIEGALKSGLIGVLIISVTLAVLWAVGSIDPVITWFQNQNWGGAFWTNVFFIVMISIAISFILKGTSASKSE
ncbi:hypothetical protein DRN73_02370 [Candidatus Pacearchaeota archaeon]|nr:MAG: hypothetical protein DRN73_02370 [Candidatus Pacearchaeota archaeon]